MKHLVTGAAGFIGSHLVDRLLADGHEVVGLDDLSSGRRAFLAHHDDDPAFRLVEADVRDVDAVRDALEGVDTVHHLAANPDVRTSMDDPTRDLEQNLVATQRLLEAMRLEGVERLAFSSTSTVYGEDVPLPTPESYGPCLPISLYGAAKLGAEAYISAYHGTYGAPQAWVFRFANIIGPRGTHGVIVDFVEKLKADPSRLEILGNGKQAKSYMAVDDCVDAMLHVVENAQEPVAIVNLGTGSQTTVTRIGEIVVEEMGLENVAFDYTGGERGWAGDVPRMLLDTAKLRKMGWTPRVASEGAVRETARAVIEERT